MAFRGVVATEQCQIKTNAHTLYIRRAIVDQMAIRFEWRFRQVYLRFCVAPK